MFKENVAASFLISNTQDLKYARSMLNIYRDVIKPFLDTNKLVFQQNVDNFDRLYSFGFPLDPNPGKSIHETRSTFSFSHHFPGLGVKLDGEKASLYHIAPPATRVPIRLGRMAHFRSRVFRENLLVFSHFYQRRPIRELQLDLNYLNCYFLPILDRIR